MHGEVRVVEDVAGAFAALTRQARPRSLALSGGDTARACYAALAGLDDLDWAGTDVVLGDERWVPVDHPDSNEGMARAVLLDPVGASRVHSARGAGATIEEAAAAYAATVAEAGPLGLVHLGLGEDGHTASLFPGSAALEETERLVVVTGDDAHPHPRLTLTYPAIAQAALAVFTVRGEAKRQAFGRVRDGEDLPAARVRAAEVVWLVAPEVVGQGVSLRPHG